MTNVFGNFIKKRFDLVIKEVYLVDTLKVLEKMDLNWKCGSIVLDSWLVSVYIPRSKRSAVLNRLKKEGIYDIKTIAKDSFGHIYYEEL